MISNKNFNFKLALLRLLGYELYTHLSEQPLVKNILKLASYLWSTFISPRAEVTKRLTTTSYNLSKGSGSLTATIKLNKP